MNLPDADKWIREAASAAEELINSKQYKLLNTGEAEKDYRKFVYGGEQNRCTLHFG